MEFCDKSMEDILKDAEKADKYIEIGEIKRLIKETLNGLKNAHSVNIVHRDLKPENILIKDGSVRICDFGSSKFIDPSGMNTPYVVSRYYRSPELIFGVTMYDSAIDIWGKSKIYLSY